ncbi:hypothetical protein VHEMI00162 [[Torrubiella] hemipterigena]|uniref:Uncharacterized protein n=1 Tax=[Torrubiella] hemipterigena TaxID=1531966 RepID=A0A0A1T136_9HYPO|nr:hypothetical protein VHEMI00162 [[Torrubiella] hemipterigena]
MALRFAGKHCAVVGGTGIIGSHIAKAFAANGAVVSVLGRSAVDMRPALESRLQPYKPPIEATSSTKGPNSHQFIRIDVSDAANIKSVFSSRPSNDGGQPHTVGPVDVLVNCAGISQTTLLKRTPDEELFNIVNTNLTAAMLVCKYANMQAQGCIINVSSLMAVKGALGTTAYAASKAGLIGFTRALCHEMSARSIRVNALLPGWVDSEMWKCLKPELKEAYLRETPLRRVASPDEVADAAVFLASNGFANNCVLNLDGGMSAS